MFITTNQVYLTTSQDISSHVRGDKNRYFWPKHDHNPKSVYLQFTVFYFNFFSQVVPHTWIAHHTTLTLLWNHFILKYLPGSCAFDLFLMWHGFKNSESASCCEGGDTRHVQCERTTTNCSIHPSIPPSLPPSIHPSIHPSICLSIHYPSMSVCPPIHPSGPWDEQCGIVGYSLSSSFLQHHQSESRAEGERTRTNTCTLSVSPSLTLMTETHTHTHTHTVHIMIWVCVCVCVIFSLCPSSCKPFLLCH